MASFERPGGSQTETLEYTKYPLRRLEPSIQKFLKVIQIDLARLHRHQLNVEKYNRLQDWTSLHTEQVNATRTIQQIKGNISQIEKSRCQVEEDDVAAFDSKIDATKHGALKSVRDFLDLMHGNTTASTPSSVDSSPDLEERQPLTFRSQGRYHDNHLQEQMQLNNPPANTEVAESWDNLQENLEELNSLIHHFAHMVDEQQESVDRIEGNIEAAQSDIQQGAKSLGKATVYKAAVFPLAGAVLGTAVAGPAGLFVGAKLGGIIGAAGGGAIGFLGGKLIKRRKETITEIELSKLSRAISEPNVHTDNSETTDSSWFPWTRKRNKSEVIPDTN